MDQNLDRNRSGIVRHKWTKAEEIDLMAQKANGETDKYLAAHFNTTRAAVANKYERLLAKTRDAELTRKAYAGKPQKQKSEPRAVTQAYQRNGARWTPEDNATLVSDADAGIDFADIGIKLNRTRWACKVQYGCLKRGTSSRGVPIGLTIPTKKTTRELALEAAAQVRKHPVSYDSLTSEFFKDPPPGRSALDRKNAGIADARRCPPAPDLRSGIRMNPITLATRPFAAESSEA